MRIAPEAADVFINFYNRLMYFAGQTRGIVSKEMSFEVFKEIDPEKRAKCREALYKPKPLFNAFLKEYGNTLTEKERAVVESWAEHHIYGKLIIMRHLKKHTIFADFKTPMNVYGVLSLFDDLDGIIPHAYLPQFIETALLPYEGVIVYDGLMLGYNMLIGSNMRRSMTEDYELAKVQGRFYTSLTEAPEPPGPEELLAYQIKEKGDLPIRKVRGLAAQVKKVKQLEWELVDAPEKKRAKLEQQLQDTRLKIAALVVEFFEKDSGKE